MRFHTDELHLVQVSLTLSKLQTSGRIAKSVRFKRLTEHKSVSHKRAFEIQLESPTKIEGDGRRAGASGSYGDMSGRTGYAATYDEWGWFLAALFSFDANAHVPNVYDDVIHFHERTTDNYREDSYMPWYGDDAYPWILVGGRGGKTGDRAGRMGQRYESQPWHGKPEYRPRWLNGKRRDPHAPLAADVQATP